MDDLLNGRLRAACNLGKSRAAPATLCVGAVAPLALLLEDLGASRVLRYRSPAHPSAAAGTAHHSSRPATTAGPHAPWHSAAGHPARRSACCRTVVRLLVTTHHRQSQNNEYGKSCR